MSPLASWSLLVVITLTVVWVLWTIAAQGHPVAVLRVMIAKALGRPLGKHRRKLTPRW